MDKIIGIYKITNPEGQIYIGSSKNILSRFRQHCSMRKKTKIHESIIKFGKENHSFEIIEICGINDLLFKESVWQQFFNSFSENNLNTYKANNTVFVNGKRKSSKSIKKNYYIDSYTGVFYKSIKEICEIYSLNICTLSGKINGYKGKKNTTRFLKV